VNEGLHSANPDLSEHGLYQSPRLRCDVVMKGGITSGVTYPKAVCEIARVHRLRNVGGTSAGAIAAAAGAAAEVGRDRPGAGFGRLSFLPKRISAKPAGQKKSVLFNLFQPSAGTGSAFNVLTAFLESKGHPFRRVWRIVREIVRAAPLAALAGAAFGVMLVVLVAVLNRTQPGLRTDAVAVAEMGLASVAGIVLALLGMVAVAGAVTVRHTLSAMVANRFGMCSGFAPGTPAPAGTPDGDDLQLGPDGKLCPKPLSTWLADELDALAGMTDSAHPLTLQDLADHGVNLKMFTTNLTDGTPYTLPFRDRKFFYAPEEFGQYFPARVVDWMRDHAPTARDAEETDTFTKLAAHDPPLLPLPEPKELPVVVMTRMSLSFPMLLSAVPVWALLYSEESVGVEPTRCWFSDGGITSNFPLHFFDSALPRWPTFAINLGPGEGLDPEDQRRNIWAPMGNEQGVEARWGEIRSVPGFMAALADTMQNWMDNAQARVPGYRDRIVLIKHTKDEGGINLNMSSDQIEQLAERGRWAGEFLVNRFAYRPSRNEGDTMGWENHRWLRYRSIMPLVENLSSGLVRGWDWVPEPELARPYPTIAEASLSDAPSYAWCEAAQRTRAGEVTSRLIDLARDWGALPDPVPSEPGPVDMSLPGAVRKFDSDHPFSCGAPRPRPALRILRDF